MEKIKCNTCGKEKSISLFHKCSKRKTGVQSRCKSCVKEYNKLYRKEINPTYWNAVDGYFSDKRKIEYIKEYGKANKTCKIYRMDLPDGSVYIGATMARLNVRLNQHINDYVTTHIKKRFKYSRNITYLHEEFHKYTMDRIKLIVRSAYILEEFEGTRYEMLKKEVEWMDKIENEGKRILNLKRKCNV